MWISVTGMVGIGNDRKAKVLEVQILDAEPGMLADTEEQMIEPKIYGTEAI